MENQYKEYRTVLKGPQSGAVVPVVMVQIEKQGSFFAVRVISASIGKDNNSWNVAHPKNKNAAEKYPNFGDAHSAYNNEIAEYLSKMYVKDEDLQLTVGGELTSETILKGSAAIKQELAAIIRDVSMIQKRVNIVARSIEVKNGKRSSK